MRVASTPGTMPVSSDDDRLKQLARDREEADRLYNEALTAVDQALVAGGSAELSAPPPDYDEAQITPLNRLWNILPAEPPGPSSGWRGRLAAMVWSLVAPVFQRQQEFNSAVVDHINRNVRFHRESQRDLAAVMGALRSHVEAALTFQARLILYLQQITWYVDTKDRALVGAVNQEMEQRTAGLSAGLSGVADELLKRWEVLGTVQQATLALKRELERRGAAAGDATAAPERAGSALGQPATLDAYKYVGFEDRYRGSTEEIRSRLSIYLPHFEGATDVLDVGCGRGEFLELLRERGITARGIDSNPEMAGRCRDAGLDVETADALAYLRALDDGSLGGLIAAQVVEHFQPGYLIRWLETAYHKLRPGARIVLETVNPACWAAFFGAYLRDITHVQPLHPETLSYLLTASGFGRVEVQFLSPYPEAARLQPAPTAPALPPDLQALIGAFNANVEKVNSLLFTFMDYAAIGVRL
jgi:SAM-dependent methyltransferase